MSIQTECTGHTLQADSAASEQLLTEPHSSSRPTTSRRGLRRTAGWLVLTCLAVVLLATAALAWALNDPARIKAAVESLVSQSTGRGLTVNGDFELRAGRWLTVQATDVSWANSTAGTEPVMASAAELTASVDLLSLARGKLVLDGVAITGGLVVLEWLPDGRLNWSLGDADSSADKSQPEPLPVYLMQAELRAIELRVLHPALQAPLSIDIDTARHTADADDRLNLDVQARLDEQPVNLSGFIGPLPELVVAGAVAFDLQLSTAISTLSATGDFDWLAGLANPDLRLQLTSADIATTLRALQLPATTTGRAEFDATVVTEAAGIDIRAGGRFGEFRLDSEFAVNDLQSLDGLTLTLASTGPSARRLGELAGVSALPDAPYTLSARAYNSPDGLLIEDVSVDAGPLQMSAAGSVGGFPAFTDIDMKLNVSSASAAAVAGLFGVATAPAAPLSLTATIARDGAEQADAVTAELRVGKATATVDGMLTEAEGFAGTTLNWRFSSTDVGQLVSRTQLAVAPNLALTASGTVVKDVTKLRVRDGTARLGTTRLKFSGTAPTSGSGGAAELTVAAAGDSLQALLANLNIAGGAAGAFTFDAVVESVPGSIRVSAIDFVAPRARVSGELNLQTASSEVNFDLAGTGSHLADIVPDLPGYSPPAAPFTITARGRVAGGTVFAIEKVAGSIGAATLSVAGTLALEPQLTATDIAIDIEGPDITELGTFAEWPFAPADFALAASTSGTAGEVVINDLVARLGDNSVNGKLRFVPGTTPTVNIELVSPRLNLDELLPQPEVPDQPAKTRLFGDEPLPFAYLANLNGFARVQASNVVINARSLRAVEAVVELQDGVLRAERLRADTELGNFTGFGSIAPGTAGHKLTLELAGEDISLSTTAVTAAASAALPKYALDARLTATGNTPRALAASANGYVWLVGGGGTIPRLDLGLLLGDFFDQLVRTLNPFTTKSTATQVVCQGAYFEVTDGRMQTSPNLVYQTSDVVIVAAGYVDLGSEKIDFTFETTPRKGIGVSLDDIVTPFTKVGGTLTQPRLTVDKQGTVVQGGAAAATGGLSILAKSLWGRWVGSRKLCEKAAERAVDTRTARDAQHVPDLARMLEATAAGKAAGAQAPE